MDNDTLSSEAILNNFGGRGNNNLENVLTIDEDDDELRIIHHSPYYSPYKLPKELCDSDSRYSVLSMNAQSINAKFGGIGTFLTIFENQNVRFDVICIQESWLDDDADIGIFQLEGYNCISQGKHASAHGGLMSYVDTKYNAERLDCSPNSSIWEGLFVKITDEETGDSSTIVNIYKPPKNNNNNENIEQFLTELDPY